MGRKQDTFCFVRGWLGLWGLWGGVVGALGLARTDD